MRFDDETGFCVPCSIRSAGVKGSGVFSDAPIAQGSFIWKPAPKSYRVYDERSLTGFLATLTDSEAIYELEHMFGTPQFPGYVVRIVDGGEMINHSSTPNSTIKNHIDEPKIAAINRVQTMESVSEGLQDEGFSVIAITDIGGGEEITLDYDIGVEDPAYYDELCNKYNIDWSWHE